MAQQKGTAYRALALGALGIAMGCAAHGGGPGTHADSSTVASALDGASGLTLSEEVVVAAPKDEGVSNDVGRPSFGIDTYLLSGVEDLGYQTPATYPNHDVMMPLAVRVDRNGSVLDPFGIELGSPQTLGFAAGNVFDGSNWLSYWVDPTTTSLRCARVRPDGTVLDPGGVVVSSSYGTTVAPETPLPPVFDGNDILLLSDRFVFTDRACNFVSDVTSPVENPLSVAFDGQHYRVLYSTELTTPANSRSFYLQAFSTAGAAVGDPLLVDTLALGASSTLPGTTTMLMVAGDLAVHAGTVGVAYSLYDIGDPPAGAQYRFRTVAADGTLGAPQTLAAGGAVTAVNDGFVLAVGNGGVHAGVDGTPIKAVSSGFYPGVLASDGTNVLIADDFGNKRLLDSDLNVSVSAVLVQAAVEQRDPSVATTADTALVAFQSGVDVVAARLAKSGELLDTPPLALESNASTVALGTDGSQFLATWSVPDSYELHARSVSGTGVLGPVVSLVTGDFLTPPQGPRVASNGTDFFVIWQQVATLQGARVSGSGSVIDTTPLTVMDDFGGRPGYAVTFDGQRYVVAVGDESMGSHVAGPIRLAFVTPATGALDVVTLPFKGDVDGLVWSAGQGLLLWSPQSGDPLIATRLGASGAPLDSPGVTLGHDWLPTEEAQVGWNGSVYLVLRTDPATGAAWLARVTKSGELLDPDGIPLADGEPWPATQAYSIASFGGDSLAAYTRFDPTPSLRSLQVRARFLRGNGLPAGQGGSSGGGNTAAGGAPEGGESGTAGLGSSDAGAAGTDGEHSGTGGTGSAVGGAHSSGGTRASNGGSGGSRSPTGGTGETSGTSTGHGGRAEQGSGGAGHGGAGAGRGGAFVAGSSGRGVGGDDTAPVPSGNGDGCGCRVATHHSSAPSSAFALLALLALRRRRLGPPRSRSGAG